MNLSTNLSEEWQNHSDILNDRQISIMYSISSVIEISQYCLLHLPAAVPDERGDHPDEQQDEPDLRAGRPGAGVAGDGEPLRDDLPGAAPAGLAAIQGLVPAARAARAPLRRGPRARRGPLRVARRPLSALRRQGVSHLHIDLGHAPRPVSHEDVLVSDGRD